MIDQLKQTRDIIAPCTPPFWAATGHLQTIWGHLLTSPALKTPGETVNVTLENENERIHSTYLQGFSKTVVYLFHGLGGSAEATYMQRTALVAQSLGHHVFLNNHRGCGKGAGLATEPYHSGRSEDLSKVIEYGRNRLPGHFHIAIGFSLSANALLLLAAGQRATVLPDVAIAVNGPIHLDRASIKLTQGVNRIYDQRFVHELKAYMLVNGKARAQKVKDLRDFDEVYTAPLGGFINRADYYETCSAKKYLSQIKIPTVLISAEDDPFVSPVDYYEAKLSPTTVLHMEKCGGHMGYLTRKGLTYERWLDTTLAAYLKCLS